MSAIQMLDTGTRRKLTLLDTVKLLCEAEVAYNDERRIQMTSSIAKFPYVRTFEAFEVRIENQRHALMDGTCRFDPAKADLAGFYRLSRAREDRGG